MIDGKDDDTKQQKRQWQWQWQQKKWLYFVLINASSFFFYSYTSITNDYNNSNNNTITKKKSTQFITTPLLVPALVIGAGVGTTGTHSMYCGTYLLGLPSVHWNLVLDIWQCKSNIINNHNNITFFGGPYNYGGDTATFTVTTNSSSSSSSSIIAMDKEQLQQQEKVSTMGREQINAHEQLVTTIRTMNECLGRGRKKKKCPPITNNMTEWMKATKEMIDKVTSWQNNNNIGAIHDQPYPEFLPYVIESATKNRNGQIPIILLSERNPIEWTKSRTGKHPVPLCRIDLVNYDSDDDDNDDGGNDDDDDNSSVTTSTSTIVTTGHFDWFSCIKRTIHAKKEKLLLQQQQQGVNIVMNNTNNIAVNVKMSEVFILYKNLHMKKNKNKEWLDGLKSHISASFDAHQNNILQNLHADYHVNMFEGTRMSHETIALEIQKH